MTTYYLRSTYVDGVDAVMSRALKQGQTGGEILQANADMLIYIRRLWYCLNYKYI